MAWNRFRQESGDKFKRWEEKQKGKEKISKIDSRGTKCLLCLNDV